MPITTNFKHDQEIFSTTLEIKLLIFLIDKFHFSFLNFPVNQHFISLSTSAK